MARNSNNPAAGAGTDLSTQLRSAMLEIVASVADFLASPQDESVSLESRRLDIVSSATKLLVVAKDHSDELIDGFKNGIQASSIRLFYEWGVFDRIPREGSISYEDLAAGADAEVSLISTWLSQGRSRGVQRPRVRVDPLIQSGSPGSSS